MGLGWHFFLCSPALVLTSRWIELLAWFPRDVGSFPLSGCYSRWMGALYLFGHGACIFSPPRGDRDCSYPRHLVIPLLACSLILRCSKPARFT